MVSVTPAHTFDLVLKGGTAKAALAAIERADARLRSVSICVSKLTDLTCLLRFERLEALEVTGWREPSFELLRKLPALRELQLQHFGGIADLSPLASLSQLQTLLLGSLISSEKVLMVQTLAPLGQLPLLETLILAGVGAMDGRLDVLMSARRLRTLHLGDHFSLESLASLAARRPELGISPILTAGGIACQKCNASRVLLKGLGEARRRAWTCSRCGATAVAQHQAEFERLRCSFGGAPA